MSDFTVSTRFTADDKVSAVMATMGSGADRFASKLSAISGGMSKVSGAFSSIAAPAAVLAGGLGLAGGNIAKSGAEFEHVLASLAAVAKPTNKELSDISATALKVGSDMGFSATEVARGMEAMIKQGLTTTEVLTGISGVAAAAAADGSTLEETMGGLLATMAGMGKGAGDLQHIADVMAKAGDLTAAGIGSLTQSMAVFGPTARQMGIPIEAAVGQLALLQDAGIDASSAGTTLAAVYSKLAAPTKRTADEMKTLGIEVADSFGNMKPPDQLMGEIFAATGKIEGNVGKAAAITRLVGLESQKALLNITASVGSGKFQKVMDSLTSGVDGYATEIARLKQASTTGDTDKFGASIDSVTKKVFQLNSGPLRGIIQATTEWVKKNEDLIASGVGEFLGDMIEALPEIVTWTKRIAIGIAVFKGIDFAVKGAAVAVEGYKGLVWATEAATKGWAVATMIFTGKLSLAEAGMIAFNAVAALNPLVWIGAAIAGVILLAVYWDKATNAVARYIDTAFSLFSDEEKAKVEKKRKAISEGKLLESDDRSGIDRAKNKGTIDGVAAEILANAKDIEAALAKGALDPGTNPDGGAVAAAVAAAPATGTQEGASAPAAVPAFSASEQAFRDAMGFGGNTGGRMFADVPTREERAANRDSKSEIVIRDETGRAKIETAPDPKSGTSLKLKQSGAP